MEDLTIAQIEGWIRQKFGPESQKIKGLRNVYRGETLLVLGNGPSLAKVPNETLSAFLTFGSNGIFLKYTPDFYITVSKDFYKHYPGRIKSLDARMKFFTKETMSGSKAQDFIIPASYPSQKLAFPEEKITNPVMFSRNPAAVTYLGGSVIFAQLQLALFMGFRRVLLAGVDHDFGVSQDAEATQLVIKDKDPHHFIDSYLPEGSTAHLDIKASNRGFKIAMKAYKRAGVELWNVTPNSKLTAVPRAQLGQFKEKL